MRIALLLSALLLTAGCDLPETKYSRTLTTKGTVSNTRYVPESWDLVPMYFPDGRGGTMTIFNTVYNAPEWWVTYKAPITTWDLHVEQSEYKRWVKNQRIIIEYREVYHVWNDKSETLYDLDFIKAYPEGQPAEEF